ncbi:MAG: P83/100 family protein [Spirochaetia bacterium]
MKKAIILLILICAPYLFSQEAEVVREELRRVEGAGIEFQNYTGTHAETSTADEISGIGEFMASRLQAAGEADADFTYFDKYRIIRAIDPVSNEGFDADIFIILPDAKVDHIDNVRLIIASYLNGFYGYSPDDSALIAYYVTIYNAVYRGDLSFFQETYKPVVNGYLTADQAGISTVYTDWPGRTRMVIPLSTDGGAIEPMGLTTDAVVEDIRRSEDMGIETRKAMVELKEKILEEEKEQLRRETGEVEEQERAIEERAAETEEERTDVSEERERIEEAEMTEDEREEALETVREREQEIQEEEEEIDRDRQELEQQQDELEERQEDVEERQQDIQEDREEIAADQRAVMEEDTGRIELTEYGAGTGIRLMIVRDTPLGPVSSMIFYDTVTKSTERTAETAVIAGRSYLYKNQEVIVLALESESSEWGTLTRLDPVMLTVLSEGEGEVYRNSTLLSREEFIFGVIRDNGEWMLAKFDEDLEIVAQSEETVDPLTPIIPARGRLYVQQPDGTVISLSPETLNYIE